LKAPFLELVPDLLLYFSSKIFIFTKGSGHQEDGGLDHKLYVLMEKKITYFFIIKSVLEADLYNKAHENIKKDLLISYKIYKICLDIKHYFTELEDEVKSLCNGKQKNLFQKLGKSLGKKMNMFFKKKSSDEEIDISKRSFVKKFGKMYQLYNIAGSQVPKKF